MTLRANCMDENRGGFCAANEGAASDGQSRERRRRQPPRVSGSFAAPQPNSDFRGSGS